MQDRRCSALSKKKKKICLPALQDRHYNALQSAASRRPHALRMPPCRAASLHSEKVYVLVNTAINHTRTYMLIVTMTLYRLTHSITHIHIHTLQTERTKHAQTVPKNKCHNCARVSTVCVNMCVLCVAGVSGKRAGKRGGRAGAAALGGEKLQKKRLKKQFLPALENRRYSALQ